jgi:menaquinone-dependent protoporphyrinogen oxidase
MAKALIVYGTRYGATAGTSEDIASVLRQEGLEAQVVDAKREKIKDISKYDLVVVGSGIQLGKWTSEPEDFLKRFQKELATKKVALFVSCGSGCKAINEGKPDVIARARAERLEEEAAKYNLQPIALGLFSGIYNYNKVPWWAKKSLEALRPRIAAVYKETQPGVYDTRDWDAIRTWAKELSQKVQSASRP